jgi:dTDP-4-dehydrorhamnose reductase
MIWITGAGGLIGHALERTAAAYGLAQRVLGLRRGDLDLLDFKTVRARFCQDAPELVIHCAGLTRSPECQADPARAQKLNVDVTVILAELAAAIPLVFFSTDLVFDGRKGDYVESDAVNPLSVYGETKARAESLVLRNPGHSVVRTSLNGGTSPSGDRGFNEELRRAWSQGRVSRLFTDEFRSPIPAIVTAAAVWELVTPWLERGRSTGVGAGAPGLYHLAGSQRMSRWEIGRALAERWPALQPRIEPGSLSAYVGAPRPPDTSLSCGKIQRLLSFPLPGFVDWLGAHPDTMF